MKNFLLSCVSLFVLLLSLSTFASDGSNALGAKKRKEIEETVETFLEDANLSWFSEGPRDGWSLLVPKDNSKTSVLGVDRIIGALITKVSSNLGLTHSIVIDKGLDYEYKGNLTPLKLKARSDSDELSKFVVELIHGFFSPTAEEKEPVESE